MGATAPVRPALRLVAVTSGFERAFDTVAEIAEKAWGPIALRSERFPFVQTAYYEPEMGRGLFKQLWGFDRLCDQADLIGDKRRAIQWETEFPRQPDSSVRRPVNIDPGYLTEAKLVLASTKDRDHRLYLGDGIFAEVTMHFQKGSWSASRWTYPDYQLPEVMAFLDTGRQWLRRQWAHHD